MAKKADFSDNEWDILADAPYLAGMGTSMADYTVTAYSKEMIILTKAYEEAKEHYAGNALIQAILAERSFHDSDDVDINNLTSDDFLKKIDEIARIVEKKSPAEECLEFKLFLYEIAMKVAKASGEGFLGLGKKVSDKESDYLGRLKETLAISFDTP
jgi:hypothetical protein